MTLEGGKIKEILQPTAALIVFGGTIGAVMVTTPLSVLARAGRSLFSVFIETVQTPDAIIEEIIGYATKARKNGIVSLEQEADTVDDPLSPQGPQSRRGRHGSSGDPQDDGTRNGHPRAPLRNGSQGLRFGRRLLAHNRHHRRGSRADSGDEAPGGYQRSRPRYRGRLRSDHLRRRLREHRLPPGRQQDPRARPLPPCKSRS